ncbi:23908_t:CDS:2 [Entrophospora sp. SA101]|nr:8828_t:CDS:2 [Entrophospora sp. SA101]CAJ0630128.1 3098_t:CDS:2 [Entrophospora sp. SA101]CAJ0749227.1 23908_t:CDS:2 [Entrophospora sp. SA101]CAJ0830005.1 12307_t:CDS:2 [Entrophospora sp. SA101]CAJ0844177.1 10452_t:CDS:2 [Entrophospora sp. SA101]
MSMRKSNSYCEDNEINSSSVASSGSGSDICKSISHALKKNKCVVVIERNDEVIREAKRQRTKNTMMGNNNLIYNSNNANDDKNNHSIKEYGFSSKNFADKNLSSSINNSSLITSSITTKTKSPNIEEGQFDILSLVPTNVIPCINLNDLAFKNGVMDERRKCIKRSKIFPLSR